MAEGKRAEDMVFAGTSSAHRYSTDPYKALLRGTAVILLVDIAILCYFTTNLFFAITNSNLKYVVILLYLGGYLIYRGYREQKDWAYPFAIVILYVIGLGFGVIGLINCLFFVLTIDVFTLLIGVIMLWAARGSILRARMHHHPMYKAAYFGQENSLDFQLESGEMLAACPTCLAVLAIQPMMLSSKDTCPHCKNPLVRTELEDRYVGGTDQEE